MTEFDLILDGSNIALYGLTEKNKDTFVVDLVLLRQKLEYFSKRGQRCLLCLDLSTLSKVQNEKIRTSGTPKEFIEIMEDYSVYFIQSDSEMAEFAVELNCPIVTNDKFRTWRSGAEKSKSGKITQQQWELIFEQSIRHKVDKRGCFTTKPPLHHHRVLKVDSPSEELAREVLQLKDANELLNRKLRMLKLTNDTLRQCINIG